MSVELRQLLENGRRAFVNGRILDFRWPRNNVWMIALIDIVAGAYLLPYGDSILYQICGFVMLVLGIGLWLKFQWARWGAMAFILMGLMMFLFVAVMKGITWKSGLRAVMHVSFLYSLWEWNVYPETDKSSNDVTTGLERLDTHI